MRHEDEVAIGVRFRFGENWSRFLAVLDDSHINSAKQSLCEMLDTPSLNGNNFLDIGSGSGLFSLAARALGATVYSFDYDPESVACTAELKERYFANDPKWLNETGSVLDYGYLQKYPAMDFVYSWGVLHHTGKMWDALKNVVDLPKKNGGVLFVALYNDQGWISLYWKMVKRFYNKGFVGRYLMISLHFPYLYILRYIVRLLSGRLKIERGMSMWRDMTDWLGGYPFEVAQPEEIIKFFQEHGYQIVKLKTVGGRMGCNEFVFVRNAG